MTMFKLPDLGEGLQDAEIIEWQVKKGEDVKVDQVIVVVETAKAIVELPSPVSGKIAKLCAKEGDTVHVGQSLVEYEGDKVESVSVVGVLTDASEITQEVERESFVVGGVSNTAAISQETAVKSGKDPLAAQGRRQQALFSPDILAFAKQLGVEDQLRDLNHSEINKTKLAQIYEQVYGKSDSSGTTVSTENPVIPLAGTKKIMAQTMMKSHQHVPAVTLFDDAHVGHWESEDITVRIIEAIIESCRKVPTLNAWFDEEALSIQTFDDINVGIAVNSNEGLFVPVLRNAQDVSPNRMRELIDKMILDVNKRSIKPQKLLGATISLSNFGTLSGRYATPIIVPPQVAIIGVGALRKEAVVKHDEIVIESVMPLSLSFDHRAATGAEAALFMKTLIDALEM